MKDCLVSLIIPVYNQKRNRFERCIDSIIEQTYKNFEVVVVDDGSSEDNLSDVREICGKDKRIQLIIQKNAGSGVARNHGVEAAKGEYIVFVDSDDMLSNYALEDAINCLTETNADIIVGQVHKEKETNANSTQIDREKPSYCILSNNADFIEYINHIIGYLSPRFSNTDRYFCDGPVAKLCKRELVLNNQFDDKKIWSEDTIWNLRITKQCKKMAISNNVWYYAFANEDSQTHIYRPNSIEEFKYRINQEEALVSQLWPECKAGLYIQIWTSMHYVFVCYLMNKQNKNSFKKKYSDFKNCINEPVYKEMLRNICFPQEESKAKTIIKNTIKHFSLHHPKVIAYFGWLFALTYKQGER